MRDPKKAPIRIQTAIAIPYTYKTFPQYTRRIKLVRLLIRLSTLALPAAMTKSKPIMAKITIRNVPVPGPMKPSYKPMKKARGSCLQYGFFGFAGIRVI